MSLQDAGEHVPTTIYWSALMCGQSYLSTQIVESWRSLLSFFFFSFSPSNSKSNVSISWAVTTCSYSTNIRYSMRNNSNSYWISVLVRDFNVELAAVSIQQYGSSTWQTATRQWYDNHWTVSNPTPWNR